MTSFRLFAQLPQEIQDAIWDLAVRPNLPAAHTFTMVNSASLAYQYGVFAASSLDQEHDQQGKRLCSQVLAAPYTDGAYSWVGVSNRSAYLIDSGLWTACRASKDAMRRRFQPLSCSAAKEAVFRRMWFDEDVVKGGLEAPNVPVTGRFTASDGSSSYLTIYPQSDLVILRLRQDDKPFKWEAIAYSATMLSCGNGGCQVRNLAIEIDESHFDENFGLKVDGSNSHLETLFTEIVAGVFIAPRIWFVAKTTIEKMTAMLQKDVTRQVFHGDRCRYIECTRDELWLPQFAIRKALLKEGRRQWYDEDLDYFPSRDYDRSAVGFLAFEELTSG